MTKATQGRKEGRVSFGLQFKGAAHHGGGRTRIGPFQQNSCRRRYHACCARWQESVTIYFVDCWHAILDGEGMDLHLGL